MKKWDIFNYEGYYVDTVEFPDSMIHEVVFKELMDQGYLPNINILEAGTY